MSEKNFKDLNAKYPLTFGDIHFDVGPGWYDILEEAAKRLEPLVQKVRETGIDFYPQTAQIKEKFGGLRWYWDNATDEMYDVIHDAEHKSFETCEECGQPGYTREGGWLRTLCDEHAKPKV